MSAEAPKNSGQGEPIPPQKSGGGFSGFLRRLTGAPSELQHPQSSTSRIVQSPPGLEGFATRIQQGIDMQLTVQSQQELEKKNVESARTAAEASRKAEAEQRQSTLIEQERVRREQTTREADEILKDFQIADRLEFIRQTVWLGKGEIRPVEPIFGITGGLELVHTFPTYFREEKGDPPNRSGRFYSWRNMPGTGDTRLSISVLGLNGDAENIRKGLMVTLFAAIIPGKELVIPIDTEESKALLEEALIRDCVIRATHNLLPHQVEKEARERLAAAKRSEGWMKWIQESEPEAQ